MQENKKLSAIYCRVSTSAQAEEGLSLDAQEAVCRETIKKDGYEVLQVIRDEGKSGGSLKRKGIQEVINLIINKKINALYVVSSDRLARNTGDDIWIRQLCRENDVILKCLNQPISEDTAMTRMVNTVFASFNQMQRDITSEKVTMTMENKASLGYFPALAPLGYINVNNPNATEKAGQKIVIKDPEKAPLVKKAFEFYATGDFSVFDITDILYEKGLRTRNGKKLSFSRMYEVLRNPFYIGEIKWGKVHIKGGKHEHLIDEYLFKKVQELLKIKGGHCCRKRKYHWLLNGFLKCYTHECRYTAEWHLKRKIAYYHCTNRNGCGKYIEINKLENMIADKFKDLEFSQEFIDLVIEKAKNIFYERRKVYDDRKKALVNQKTAFETKRKIAEDKLFTNTISDNDFKRIREEIANELSNIDDRVIKLEKERGVNVDIAQQVLNLSRNIYDAYNKASFQLKRQYLGFFWERFEIADGLIIKSVTSLIFAELLRFEKAFYKTQKQENPYKPIVSNEVINISEVSARSGSNRGPYP